MGIMRARERERERENWGCLQSWTLLGGEREEGTLRVVRGDARDICCGGFR